MGNTAERPTLLMDTLGTSRATGRAPEAPEAPEAALEALAAAPVATSADLAELTGTIKQQLLTNLMSIRASQESGSEWEEFCKLLDAGATFEVHLKKIPNQNRYCLALAALPSTREQGEPRVHYLSVPPTLQEDLLADINPEGYKQLVQHAWESRRNALGEAVTHTESVEAAAQSSVTTKFALRPTSRPTSRPAPRPTLTLRKNLSPEGQARRVIYWWNRLQATQNGLSAMVFRAEAAAVRERFALWFSDAESCPQASEIV